MRAIPFVLAAAAAFGQVPPAAPGQPASTVSSAPPEVDAALRARVTQFYQLEVEGKFSKALDLVAEDTKDLFVGSSKPTYRSFEIRNIEYYDDNTKASVMLVVTRLLPIEGFMGHPLPTKTNSRWKLENGQWCYFVDPEKDLPATPFGRMGAGPNRLPSGGSPGTPGTPPPAIPASVKPPPPQALLTTDKSEVKIKTSGPSSEQVVIRNPSKWPMALSVTDPKIAGLTVKLDRQTMKPGEKAILSIQSGGKNPLPKKPVLVVVRVPQTNQVIPITVTFAN
ncbi:MAG TPA: hypothetical protein VMT86_14760 [Bryobacteraceae bacterium]|nr:hypothetical protein [Bryobacteraceae bacterium]